MKIYVRLSSSMAAKWASTKRCPKQTGLVDTCDFLFQFVLDVFTTCGEKATEGGTGGKASVNYGPENALTTPQMTNHSPSDLVNQIQKRELMVNILTFQTG